MGRANSATLVLPALVLLLSSVQTASLLTARPDTQPSKSADNDGADSSKKKGIGAGYIIRGHPIGAAQLEALHVSWYYNWATKPRLDSTVEFVPMVWSKKSLDDKTTGDYILGFNEPDLRGQADMPVEEAIKSWPILSAKAKYVGSPATAKNPAESKWFKAFMKSNPRVDFITVHWYGSDAQLFIKEMEEIHEAYNKPIWVTEFAVQGHKKTDEAPDKYSQAEVDKFIIDTTRWMNKTSYVERYAWHNPGKALVGTSSLFDASGALTETGKTYAAVH